MPVYIGGDHLVVSYMNNSRVLPIPLHMCLECQVSTVKKAAFISVVLDGFEYHWYNRSDVYDNYGSRKGNGGKSIRLCKVGEVSFLLCPSK